LFSQEKVTPQTALNIYKNGEVEWIGEHPMQTTLLEHPQSSHKHY
jgi:hypothetical protein